MNRILVTILCSMLYGFTLHAEEAVQGGAAAGPAQTQPTKPAEDTVTGGGEAEEPVALDSGFHHSPGQGYSWRNVQERLQSMNLTKCRLGGSMAKDSIPRLESAGFCNVLNITDTKKLPVGTVWVYTGGRAGNTIIKVGKDQYFDNRMMSALPHPHNQKLIGIMKPGCGKITQTCSP